MNKIHRYISFFLCLSLILFCLSPIRAQAVADPVYSSAYAVVGGVVVEGFKEGAKVIASALGSVWNKVFTYDLLQTAQGVLEIGSFFSDPTSYKSIFSSYSEGELTAGQVVLSKAFLSSVAAAYKTKTGVSLSVPSEDVVINVPPESVWTEAELITYERLLSKGFADLTEVNKNILAGNQITWQLKQDFSSLALYLRTTFNENLSAEFDSLTSSITSALTSLKSTLSSKFDSLETSVDVMSSTVSGHLKDLKTLYSSYGNSTLSKLDSVLGKFDTLTEAIVGIESGDWSTDFDHLKQLYTQFGNATLDMLESVKLSTDEISNAIFASTDSLSSHISSAFEDGFTLISESLSDITVEATFPDISDLSTLLDAQWIELISISEVLSSVSYDVSSISGMLETTLSDFLGMLYNIESVSFDISSAVEDLCSVFTSENFSLTLSDISLSASSLSALQSSFEDYFTAFSDMYFDEYLEMYYGLLDWISTETSSIYRVLDTYLYDIRKSIKTDVIGTLNDIKTSIQSIAGTTTADPGTGDDNSQDDYEKEKAPLIPWIGSGFSVGGSYFNSIQGFLGDDLDAFLVAGMIFEEFAGMSFFYKLIIISSSVGLIGTLLGMALNVASYSVAQRRREEAAQSRAHVRMERSAAA